MCTVHGMLVAVLFRSQISIGNVLVSEGCKPRGKANVFVYGNAFSFDIIFKFNAFGGTLLGMCIRVFRMETSLKTYISE